MSGPSSSASPPSRARPPSPSSPPPSSLSADDFRRAVREELRAGGVVDAITAQFRSRVALALAGATATARENSADDEQEPTTLTRHDRAFLSMILECLEGEGMVHAAAVFGPESGILRGDRGDRGDTSSPMSPREFLDALGMEGAEGWMTRWQHHACASPMRHDEEARADRRRKPSSFLRRLVIAAAGAASTYASGISTHTQTATDPRHGLTMQLERTREKYQKMLESEGEGQARGVEEAMIRFRAECEERTREELRVDLERFKKRTIAEMRLEEAARHRKELNRQRSELAADYDLRLQRAREELSSQLRGSEMSHLHAKQEMVREMEILRQKDARERELLDAEKRNLSAEAERVKQMSTSVEAKLKRIENRERSVMGKIESEYERAREEAKKTYESSMEAIAAQREFNDQEMKAIQGERKLISGYRSELVDLKRALATKDREISSLREKAASMEARCTKAEKEVNEIVAIHSGEQSAESVVGEPGEATGGKGALVKQIIILEAELENTRHEAARVRSSFETECAALRSNAIDAKQEAERAGDMAREAEAREENGRAEMVELQALLEKSQRALSFTCTQGQNKDGVKLDIDRRLANARTLASRQSNRSSFSPRPSARINDITTKNGTSGELFIPDRYPGTSTVVAPRTVEAFKAGENLRVWTANASIGSQRTATHHETSGNERRDKPDIRKSYGARFDRGGNSDEGHHILRSPEPLNSHANTWAGKQGSAEAADRMLLHMEPNNGFPSFHESDIVAESSKDSMSVSSPNEMCHLQNGKTSPTQGNNSSCSVVCAKERMRVEGIEQDPREPSGADVDNEASAYAIKDHSQMGATPTSEHPRSLVKTTYADAHRSLHVTETGTTKKSIFLEDTAKDGVHREDSKRMSPHNSDLGGDGMSTHERQDETNKSDSFSVTSTGKSRDSHHATAVPRSNVLLPSEEMCEGHHSVEATDASGSAVIAMKCSESPIIEGPGDSVFTFTAEHDHRGSEGMEGYFEIGDTSHSPVAPGEVAEVAEAASILIQCAMRNAWALTERRKRRRERDSDMTESQRAQLQNEVDVEISRHKLRAESLAEHAEARARAAERRQDRMKHGVHATSSQDERSSVSASRDTALGSSASDETIEVASFYSSSYGDTW